MARSKWRMLRLAPLGLLLLISTSACDPSFGWLHSVTPQGERMRHLWIGACFAALVVGGFVTALMVYAMIAFRRRDNALPRQVRVNLPVEILYTVVPFVIVAALFFYTAVDEVYVGKTTASPASHGVVVVDVEAFQWGWTFRYVSESGTYDVPMSGGTQPQQQAVFVTGSSNTVEPTLVLPENTPVQFQLHSDNVIHSFYVPQLLYKLDVIPGRTNKFQISGIDRTGSFEGHCAELCGFDHARMNFILKTVTPAAYQTYMASMVAQDQYQPIPSWVVSATPAGSIA